MTELDLQQSLIPMTLIEHLARIMPQHSSGEGYDYEKFLEALVNGPSYTISNGNSDEKWSRTRNQSISSVDSSNQTEVARVTGGMARGSRHYL